MDVISKYYGVNLNTFYNKIDNRKAIKGKSRVKKYLDENSNIYLDGISFDKKQKNVSGFECGGLSFM